MENIINKVLQVLGCVFLVLIFGTALGVGVGFLFEPRNGSDSSARAAQSDSAGAIGSGTGANGSGTGAESSANSSPSVSSGSSNATPGNLAGTGSGRSTGGSTYSGDLMPLLGMAWDEALDFWGYRAADSTANPNNSGLANRIFNDLIGSDEMGIRVFMEYIISGMTGDQRPWSYFVRQIEINPDAYATFCGIGIGDTLVDAEQRLTSGASRIKGGVAGGFFERGGEITEILIGNASFTDNASVEQYLSGGGDLTVRWTVEIDEIIYFVNLSTTDFSTVSSMSITSNGRYNSDPDAPDPFEEIVIANRYLTEPTPLGLECLDPNYWR